MTSKFMSIVNWKPRPKHSIPARGIRVNDWYEGERVLEVFPPGEVFTTFITASGVRAWRNDFTITIERDEL